MEHPHIHLNLINRNILPHLLLYFTCIPGLKTCFSVLSLVCLQKHPLVAIYHYSWGGVELILKKILGEISEVHQLSDLRNNQKVRKQDVTLLISIPRIQCTIYPIFRGMELAGGICLSCPCIYVSCGGRYSPAMLAASTSVIWCLSSTLVMGITFSPA